MSSSSYAAAETAQRRQLARQAAAEENELRSAYLKLANRFEWWGGIAADQQEDGNVI
jgi:hypothetical protein